jgi:hypothetical protein
MKPQGYVPPSAPPSAHEASDLHIPIILRVAAILGVTLVASILIIALFFRSMEHAYGPRTSEAAPEVMPSELPPSPTLQMHPLRDLQEVRRLEDSHLDNYGWIDRQHGVAQIPVDRAMVLWVKSYSAAPPPVPAGSVAPTTNGPPVQGPTELQMRQQKAQEAPHGP